MWARSSEIAVACWLAMSPFIFRHGPEETFLWANDLISALVIAVISLTALWPPAEKLHFANLIVSAWLIGVTFLTQPSPPPPAYQNYVTVALLLVILAMIPTRSHVPPRAWSAFHQQKRDKT